MLSWSSSKETSPRSFCKKAWSWRMSFSLWLLTSPVRELEVVVSAVNRWENQICFVSVLWKSWYSRLLYSSVSEVRFKSLKMIVIDLCVYSVEVHGLNCSRSGKILDAILIKLRSTVQTWQFPCYRLSSSGSYEGLENQSRSEHQ